MLEMFRNAISEEEMFRLVRKLFEKAEAGDMSPAKLIFSYKIGKPLPAPHPDSIDRDEWEHYQKDAMHEKEMAIVMNALPSAVGNDIARVSLPIMTAARKNDLGMQLMAGMDMKAFESRAEDPEAQAEENEQVETNAEERAVGTQPIANGKINVQTQRQTAQKGAGSNGKINRTANARRTRQSAPLTAGPAEKKTPGKTNKRKAKTAWVRPLAKQFCKILPV